MKTDKDLSNEIFKDFVEEHTELQFQTNNQLHQLINAKAGEYASVAITFAIKWLKDEEALKKGLTLPSKLSFKLKDGVYVQEDEEEEKVDPEVEPNANV